MASARDKCFGKAVQKLKDNGKLQDLKVQDQQRWVRDATTKQWSQTNEVWYKVVGMVSRVGRLLRGGGTPDPGAADGTRIPDMTVTRDGQNPVVIDNKFEGDDWTDAQRDAYNDINKQQSGDPKAKNLKLDPAVCKCGEPGAMDPVPVPKPAPFMVPGASPVQPFSPAPSTAGAAAGEAAGEAATGAFGGIGELVFP
jgi:hypothetical protein